MKIDISARKQSIIYALPNRKKFLLHPIKFFCIGGCENVLRTNEVQRRIPLVELLIVIVVIGVLSAMIMFAANEFIETSRAATIISNLKNLKSAVMFWYVDNQDKLVKQSNNGAYLVKYNGDQSPVQEFWENRKGTSTYRDTSGFKADVLRYMSNAANISASGSEYSKANGSLTIASNAYRLNDNDENATRDQWFIGYVISDGKGRSNSTLKSKFAGRAKSLGLLQTNKKNSAPYTNGDVVWLMVIQF